MAPLSQWSSPEKETLSTAALLNSSASRGRAISTNSWKSLLLLPDIPLWAAMPTQNCSTSESPTTTHSRPLILLYCLSRIPTFPGICQNDNWYARKFKIFLENILKFLENRRPKVAQFVGKAQPTKKKKRNSGKKVAQFVEKRPIWQHSRACPPPLARARALPTATSTLWSLLCDVPSGKSS